MRKKCKICKVYFFKSLTLSKKRWEVERKYCSNSCRGVAMRSWKKEQANSWKGKNIQVGSKHSWIIQNYGSANHCENRKKKMFSFECKKISKKFHYAIKHGRKYSRNVNDYIQLCVSCHKYYDFTDKARRNLSLSHLGQTAWNKGKKMTKEFCEKIRQSKIKYYKTKR